jgi:serine/threonine protein kinase
MRSLNHPNIIRLYETFRDDIAYYLVLEKFGSPWDSGCETPTENYKISTDGFYINIPVGSNTSATMFEYIENCKNGKVSFRFLKPLFRQIANAVNYIHSQKIVHADIKEENILIDSQDGELIAKICDFGHAYRFVREPKMKLYGTKVLSAPELICHLNNEYIEDPLVSGFEQDVWAMGLLFYTMIHGHLPEENDAFVAGDIELTGYKYYPTSFDDINDSGNDCVT